MCVDWNLWIWFQLKLVLDLVENSQQQKKTKLISPSEQQNISSPSGFPPVVQEVGIELKETIGMKSVSLYFSNTFDCQYVRCCFLDFCHRPGRE